MPDTPSVPVPLIRKGQAPDKLQRAAFGERFREAFADPAFEAHRDAVERLEEVAWQAYDEGRKAPVTRKAGPGYADPDYDLSVDWIEARARIEAAGLRQAHPATPSRVLAIVGSARNDGSCPGEKSKTFRLVELAREQFEQAGIECDVLDLSLLTSDYGRRIHPCKGCASTAMPLCHWPCSCYPNHGLGQGSDWMNEIYERLVAAHGVLVVTPVYWWQAPSVLKLMIDRLVCADGGNPDPTATQGKDAGRAKEIELQGWDYPKHLAGRAYGVFVHGDVAGVESLRRSLCDWFDWMGLVDAGRMSQVDRYIGYYGPYADSHDTLDRDAAVQEEMRNAARALVEAVGRLRAHRLAPPDAALVPPRPK